MPSGTDLGKLIIRQALPRGASVKPQMKVLDGDLTSIEVLFVPKSGLSVTGFVMVGAGLETLILEGTPLPDSTSGGYRSTHSVKTGTPRVGFKYKLYAKTASATETKQPSATVVYDEIFGWSPVKKSSSVQNLEVKGDTVFGKDNTNSKARFKGTGGVTVDSTLSVAGDSTVGNSLIVTGSGARKGEVRIVQTDKTTVGSAAILELSGTAVVSAANSPPGGSKYTFFKGCGPLGSGVIYQDSLQLLRFGPTGAVNSTGSNVLIFSPKMLPNTSGSPAENLATLFADVSVGGKLAVSGAATVGGLRAGGVASGSFTGVLPANTSVTILNITQPCFLEVFAQANPLIGDERYIYQQLAVLGAATVGGNRFIGANGSGLTVAGSATTITAVNGTPGSPTAYGTPVTISLNSVGGGGAAQSWSGSWRVIAIPDPFGPYTGAIATQTQSYSVPV